MALRVLAHFVPGDKVLDFLAPETDWLDIRYCAEDDEPPCIASCPKPRSSGMCCGRCRAPISSGRPVQAGAQAGRGRQHHRRRGRNAPRHRGGEHAGGGCASVAEGAVLLMLAALRRLPELDRATRAGTGWPSDPRLGETVRDIGGCTVGLIGYGNIAKRVEAIVTSMGADVIHTSTRDDGRPGWRSLPVLLAASDIVSLHLPWPPTADLLDAAALGRMSPERGLVNTSRGPIIDEACAGRRATRGRLAAAGSTSSPSSRYPPTTRYWASRMSSSLRTSPGTRSTPCGATWPRRSTTAPDARRPRAGQPRERGHAPSVAD